MAAAVLPGVLPGRARELLELWSLSEVVTAAGKQAGLSVNNCDFPSPQAWPQASVLPGASLRSLLSQGSAFAAVVWGWSDLCCPRSVMAQTQTLARTQRMHFLFSAFRIVTPNINIFYTVTGLPRQC